MQLEAHIISVMFQSSAFSIELNELFPSGVYMMQLVDRFLHLFPIILILFRKYASKFLLRGLLRQLPIKGMHSVFLLIIHSGLKGEDLDC